MHNNDRKYSVGMAKITPQPLEPGSPQWTREFTDALSAGAARIGVKHLHIAPARAAAAVLKSAGHTPADDYWAGVLGPVLAPGAVARLLNVSPQRVTQLRNEHAVLGVKAAGTRHLFPRYQFDIEAGRIREVARKVFRLLLDEVQPVTLAQWLAEPNAMLASPDAAPSDWPRPRDAMLAREMHLDLLEAATDFQRRLAA